MRITLEVKKERFPFFIELIKSLGFVKIIAEEPGNYNGHSDLKSALTDVKLHQRGRKKLKTIEEFLDEI
jgi:hypothetical protein